MERPMRRVTGLLIGSFVASLAIGCGSETSPPTLEPAIAETTGPVAAKGSKVALKKKKKEPGIGAVPVPTKRQRLSL
jgi:hypothetical protein